MTITLVQGNARGASDTAPVSVTMTDTPVAGNLLIAVVGSDNYPNNQPVTSISQTGVSWSLAVLGGDTGVLVEVWYGVVGAGASKDITVNFAGGHNYGAIVNVCEWSGLAISSPVDKTATSPFGSAFVTGTTPTTSQADELCVGGIDSAGPESAPTNSFTLLDGTIQQHYLYCSYLYRIVSSTGAYGCGVTGDSWSSGAIATFKASGASLKTVADSLGLSDSVLRHKAVLPISDVVGLAELILRHKTLAVSDGVGASDVARTDKSPLIAADALSLVDAILRNKQFALADTVALADAVSTPSRVLRAIDAVGLADGALVNKVLQLTESISLVEVVEVGTGGAAKKTKLFLILGELALQLTGD